MKNNLYIIVVVVIVIGIFFASLYLRKSNPNGSENATSTNATSSEQASASSSNEVANVASALGTMFSATSSSKNNINNVTNNQTKKMTNLITLKTSLGDIQFETYEKDAPNTVANFVKLASQGFYNGITFHRVIKGFMIQGGDPNCSKAETASQCGMGGPGYQFADELNPATDSYKAGYKKGVVAMANAGPNTNGSQFFIMLADNPLPNAYSIFGKVVKGQEVVDVIGNVKTGANDRPVETVTIKSVTVSQI